MTKINFSSIGETYSEHAGSQVTTEEKSFASSNLNSDLHELINQNQKILLEVNPGKLLYSIKEAAKILGVSYEFIRANICGGRVIANSFGARKLIHLNELSKLITEGIPV